MNKFKKTSFGMILFLLLALLVMVSLSTSFAADRNITNTTDGGISGIVNSSLANDKIILSDGVYSGNNNKDIIINKNLTITGTNKANTVLDLGSGDKLFTINSGANLILANLTIKNAQIGNNSYLINNDGSVTIQDCVFTDNTINLIISKKTIYTTNPNAYHYEDSIGTGYLVLNNGEMVIQDSAFNNNKMNIQYNYYEEVPYTTNTTIVLPNIVTNSTYVTGGGLVANKGKLNITRSNFTNNNIYTNQSLNYNYSANQSIIITRENSSGDNIGSQTIGYVYAFIVNNNNLEITNSIFTNNTHYYNTTRNDNKNITITTTGGTGKITTYASFINFIFNSANLNIINSEFRETKYNSTDTSNSLNSAYNYISGGIIYTTTSYKGISETNIKNSTFNNNNAANNQGTVLFIT
ncbi:hypothetical protein, partial [Methanobrevibacter cuticularis]|uniref:hypothetical protein n=1 Tax=Methanobrevibacter cuticularis TaxID=47311 RepID=UPI000A000E46